MCCMVYINQMAPHPVHFGTVFGVQHAVILGGSFTPAYASVSS